MPFDVFLVLEKGTSFYNRSWVEDHPDWALRGMLCKQLLSGLSVIHTAGYMHRDITPMNILYFPTQPRHAALCDFGKMHNSPIDTETALAAWQWLPPEIVKVNDPTQRRRYDQKIDIWMLALSLIFTWFPPRPPKMQLDRGAHKEIIKRLDSHIGKEPIERSNLASLLQKLLAWDAKSRPSAAEALRMPSLYSIAMAEDDQQGEAGTGQKRSQHPMLSE